MSRIIFRIFPKIFTIGFYAAGFGEDRALKRHFLRGSDRLGLKWLQKAELFVAQRFNWVHICGSMGRV